MTELAKRIASFLRRNKFLSIFIANAVLMTYVLCFLPVRFEENDDICMLLISSGSYSGTPDAHLIFINYIYGIILKLLYSGWMGVEWYALSFVVLHIVSISVILFSVIKSTENIMLKFIFALLFYSVELQVLLHLQFTTTAALVCLAGLVLLLEPQPYRRITGVMLCVIGSWLRLEIALVVLSVSFPLFIREMLEYKRLRFSQPLAYLGIAILLIGAFEVVDQASYGEENGWKAYVAYNKVRGQINDNPAAPALIDRLPPAIKPVDYALLLRFFQDGTVLNIGKLNLVVNELKLVNMLNKSIVSLFLYKKYMFILAFILLLSIMSCKAQTDVFVLLATIFIFSLIMCTMALIVSLKYRIFISILSPLIYSIYRSVKIIKVNFFSKLLPSSLVLLFLYSADYSYQFIGQNNYLKGKVFEQYGFIADYMVHSNNILVPYAADYRTEGTPIFSVSKMHFKRRMFFGGWLTNVPLNKGYYTSHYDFTKEHSLFLRQASRNILPMLVESIYINYGVRVKPIVTAESEQDLIVEFKPI